MFFFLNLGNQTSAHIKYLITIFSTQKTRIKKLQQESARMYNKCMISTAPTLISCGGR